MAEHPRQLIRHRVVAILKAGVPELRERVYRSRLYPMQRGELPGACVYSLREQAEEISLKGTLDRRLDLAIDLYVRHGETPDDALDDLALAVEAAMAADRTLGGTAKWNRLEETAIGFAGEGETANGLARLRYLVGYITPG